MIYTWFKIFNKDEFEDLDLVSRTYSLNLSGVGTKDILVTKGIGVGMTYDGVFLSLELEDQNPFEFEDKAIYIDENNDVYLGVGIAN